MSRHCFSLFLFLVLLAGCEVPDVQPFAEATTSMSTAIATSLQHVSTDFQRLDSLNPGALTGAQHDSLVIYQGQLAAAVKAFGAVPKAFDAYAGSLVAITDARTKGDKRIEAVTGAIGQLAAAAGPWGTAVGLATKPLDDLLRDLNSAKTLHSLAKKVEAQDSAIQRISRYLAAGIRAFNHLDALALKLYANNMAGQYYPVKKYYNASLYTQNKEISILQNIAELNKARYQWQDDHSTGAEQDVMASAKMLAKLDPELAPAPRQYPGKSYFAVLDARRAYHESRLISPQVAALYREAQQHLTAYYTEQQRNQLLLDKCAAIITTWAQSHRALHISLNKAQHHLMTKELFDQAQAIKKAADDIRALKLRAAS